MADEHDLLGKADALLRRHAPPRTDPAHTEVPRLTELITPGASTSPELEPPPDPAGMPMLELEPSLAPPEPEPAQPADEAAFTPELVAEVLTAVEARLAQDLEHRLSLHLANEVQAAVAATLGDLRQEIADAVGEALAQALRQRNQR